MCSTPGRGIAGSITAFNGRRGLGRRETRRSPTIRNEGGLVGPPCSRNPHGETVVVRRAQSGTKPGHPPRGKTSKLGGSIYIVRRAQLRIDHATLVERDRRTRRGEGEWSDGPSCSQRPHDKRDGMTPVLIPCSRSAHDQNVLARRPQ